MDIAVEVVDLNHEAAQEYQKQRICVSVSYRFVIQ